MSDIQKIKVAIRVRPLLEHEVTSGHESDKLKTKESEIV